MVPFLILGATMFIFLVLMIDAVNRRFARGSDATPIARMDGESALVHEGEVDEVYDQITVD